MERAQVSEVEPPIYPPQSPYEHMCRALYANGFGTIGFLDLIDRFEEALQIKPPQIDFHNNLEQKE